MLSCIPEYSSLLAAWIRISDIMLLYQHEKMNDDFKSNKNIDSVYRGRKKGVRE